MIDNKKMAEFLLELRNRYKTPINGDEYRWLGDIADYLIEDIEIEPICKILFDVPFYFCGKCKTMLNMYDDKAKYCSECGHPVKWSDGKPCMN